MYNSPILSSPVTALAGNPGSGKTTLAINLALLRAADGRDVTAVDLDIVTPDFRLNDRRDALTDAGVDCLFAEYPDRPVKLSRHLTGFRPLFADEFAEGRSVVVDLGGDGNGMVDLGVFAGVLRKAKADIWLVLNAYCPLAPTVPALCAKMEALSEDARVTVTGIVANPNKGAATTVADISASAEYYRSVALATGMAPLFTCVPAGLASETEAALSAADRRVFGELLPIRLFTEG